MFLHWPYSMDLITRFSCIWLKHDLFRIFKRNWKWMFWILPPDNAILDDSSCEINGQIVCFAENGRMNVTVQWAHENAILISITAKRSLILLKSQYFPMVLSPTFNFNLLQTLYICLHRKFSIWLTIRSLVFSNCGIANQKKTLSIIHQFFLFNGNSNWYHDPQT